MQKSYNHLDGFLLQKMLGCKKDYNAFSEEERYQAYRMFLKRTGEKGKRIAATQTIQKWFGIGGQKRPNHEGLFKLGFALELSDKEMRELLVYVTCEPDFQVNDYREMIFCMDSIITCLIQNVWQWWINLNLLFPLNFL